MFIPLLFVAMSFILVSPTAHAVGTAAITPSSVQVESKVTMHLTYSVGPGGMTVGDSLEIGDPVFHGASWSRWGKLAPWSHQCTPLRGDDNGVSSTGKVGAESSAGDVILTVNRSNCNNKTENCVGDYHAMSMTQVIVEKGTLNEGDTISVVIGDTTENVDCGLQTGSRSFPPIPWPVHETIGGVTTELVSPTVAITPILEPENVLVVAPSQVLAGEAFEVKISVLDTWGNAIPKANLQTNLSFTASGKGSNQNYNFSSDEQGWENFTVTINDPTVEWVTVTSTLGTTKSNPIEVLIEYPEYRVFWGDIHSHHGFTWTNEMGVRQDMNHIYARDVIGLDVATESMKAQFAEIDGEALWTELQQTCHEMSVDDSYLVLQGFEWLGGLEDVNHGHHNIYYNSCDGPVAVQDDLDGVDGENGIWAFALSVRDELGIDVVAVPHAMQHTGFYYDTHNSEIQKVAEIYSGWGDSTGQNGALGGSLAMMFQKDIRLGFIGSSDNHDGWMGNPHYLAEQSLNRGGGYVAFVAKSLNRADIFDSLKKRRTYATTANRGIVHFYAEDKGSRIEMGTEYLAHSPTLGWTVHGADKIVRVELFTMEMGGKTPMSTLVVELYTDTWTVESSQLIDWDGVTNMAYWLRVTQLDGETLWSSPIWLTSDCKRLTEGAVDPLYICGGPKDTADTADTADTETPTETTQDSGKTTAGHSGDNDTESDQQDTGSAKDCGCLSTPFSGASFIILGIALMVTRRSAGPHSVVQD